MRISVGSASVDDQYVPTRSVCHVLAEVAFEQAFEESGFFKTDDNQVGIPLVGQLQDPLCPFSNICHELGANRAPFEQTPRPLETSLGEVELLGRLACETFGCSREHIDTGTRQRGLRDDDHHKRGVECLRKI